MSEGAAERPFWEQRGAPAPVGGGRLFAALVVVAGLAGAAATYAVGFLGGGRIGLDLASRVVYLVGYAGLPVLGFGALIAGLLTIALAWTPRRKDRRRGWFDDFGPLFLSALVGGGLALAVVIAPAFSDAEAEVAVTAALDGHHRRVNADNLALNEDLRLLVIRNGRLLDPARLARDPGQRKAAKGVAEARALYARYRARADARFAESRASLVAFAGTKPWRDKALADWDRRIAPDREVVESFYNGQEEIMDSVETLLRRLRNAPGRWDGDAYVFYRLSDFEAFQGEIRQHRALVDDVNAQAMTMGLTNFESINRATATVDR